MNIVTVTSSITRRQTVAVRLIPLGLSYLILVGALLAGTHGFTMRPTVRLVASYVVLVLFVIWTVFWTLVVERRSPASWGLTGSGVFTAVILNAFFTLVTWSGFGALPGRPPLAALIPALLSASFEAVYFYGWIQYRLWEYLGFTSSLILSALLYAFYHVGYLGLSSSGLDALTLSLGLYVLVGVTNIVLVRATGSLFALWPFYLTAATLYDYHRLNLALSWNAVPWSLFLIPVLGVLAIGLYRSLRGSYRGSRSFPTAEIGPFLLRGTIGGMLQLQWRRLVRAAVILWLALLGGLFIRYIINDPITLDTVRFMGSEAASRFLAQRSTMAELSLRLGLAIYLVIPLFILLTWLDWFSASRDGLHASKVISMALANAGLVLGLMLLCLPVIVLLAYQAGQSPTSDDLLRFGLVVLVAILYTLLCSGLIVVLTCAVVSRVWRWFIGWLMYIFIYNWWMIYPLFSQYSVVGLPGSNNPMELSQWMTTIWQRATMLYSFVPQYHYYLALTVTYLRDVLDNRFFLPSLTALASYALAAWLLALTYISIKEKGRVSKS